MPHRHLRLPGLVLSLALTACDCGGPEVEPGALTVTASPVDGARDVGVLAPITLTLSHALSNDVGDASAALVWDHGFNEQPRLGTTIAGTLSVSGKVVSFTPAQPLEPGISYHFTLSGLETAAGAVPAQSLHFRTWSNPQTVGESYSAPGTQSQRTEAVYDADGALLESRIYNQAGSDGEWGTADDVQNSLTLYSENQSGHWTRSMAFADPGADTAWGTADDVLRYHQQRTFDAAGGLTLHDSFSGTGPDSEPFTADDPITFRRHTMFDGDGMPTRHTYLTGPGPDTQWLTGDDVATGYSTYEYDSAGRRVRSVAHSRGPDDILYTADDEIVGYTEYTFDASGQRVAAAEVLNPGTDGTWFTADDSERWPYEYEYDANGLLTRETWLDDSNQVGGYEDHSYDSAGHKLTWTRYKAGPDGLWKTADDYPEFVYHYATP